jgi:antitoxin (DNA-binding transcriptional repressor) of toxin-antitoxin stability system
MAIKVTIPEASLQFPQLMGRVLLGEEIIICDDSEGRIPIAKIAPSRKKRLPRLLRQNKSKNSIVLDLDKSEKPQSLMSKLRSIQIDAPEELANEIDKIPEQYWSNLLQIIRLFRESVTPVLEVHSQDAAIVEAIEDLGLVHAMLEVKNEKPLSLQEALAEMERA